MARKMIINAIDPEEVRLAVLNDAQLEHFDIETRGTEKNKGNIYKAKVIDVEPSLNAAFVDYGADKQGFLTAGDVDPRLAKHNGGPPRKSSRGGNTIADLLTPKQDILVQITKDEVGQKGAVLTTYLSLAGRYLVLTPDSQHTGVSRKLGRDERDALFDSVDKLDVPDGMGVIMRTAGRDRASPDLQRDLDVLLTLWDSIKTHARGSKAPQLIYKDQDVVIRALRDYYVSEIDEVILDSDEAYDRAAEYIRMVMPRQRSVLSRYVERRPIFHHYRIEQQLEALFEPRVDLPSGGSIVIEPTEALVSIDVNSGKQKSGGHEETAAHTNLEAAVEIARQLRLRDLGGIVVIDFIDMLSRKNQARVEQALKAVLKSDKARIKIGRISRNGTLELTRQRIRSALHASVSRTCTVCKGTGNILNPSSHATAILRRLFDRVSRADLRAAKVRVEAEAANILRTDKWSVIQDIEQRNNIRIDIIPEPTFSPGQDDFTFETDPNATPIEPPEPNFGAAVIPEELRAELEAAEARDRAELAAQQAQDLVERTKRRRNRRRGRKRGGEPTRDGAPFDMPSFELVDPRLLKPSTKGNDRGRARDPDRDRTRGPARNRDRNRDQAGEPRRKRSRHRRRRGPAPEIMPASEALAKTTPARAVAKKRPGFFAWLFSFFGLFGGSQKPQTKPPKKSQ